MKPILIPLILAAFSAPSFAQLNDSPAVDMKAVLTGLRQFKEQNEIGLRTRRNAAYQQIMPAAASNEAAAALWSSAVLATEIAGVDHETAAARAWTKGEGEGFKAKEATNAARLHLVWLGLTLQHISDAETAQLLPKIIDFTKQLEADDAAAGRLSEHFDKMLDRIPGAKAKNVRDIERNLERLASTGKPLPGVKEALAEVRGRLLHDSILKTAVADSPVAKKLQIVEILGESGSKKKNKKGGDNDGSGPGWEPVPGNVSGIYTSIILPEFRDKRDPRLLEYWDMMLRKNQESLYAGMPAFDEKQKTQIERPKIMWDRTQDMLILGLKNRAVTEMFNLIKANPQHPDAAAWIAKLEQIVAPAPSPDSSTPGTGTVAPPRAIPSATAVPGNPPTAIIVPGAPAAPR